MRNLRNLQHSALTFSDDEAPLTATTWDGRSVVCSFGPTEADPAVTLRRFPSQDAFNHESAIVITSWDAPSPNPDLACDKILSLHCFPDSGTICLVLEGGDIILVREDAQPGEDLIEIVGSVDAGIAAAAWSPDEELLLIATKADTLLFMTREFEGTATVSLSSGDLKISNHVSVGWGKKETQFQGRGAKALRDPTVPEHVDEGKLSDFDDSQVTISWRGDGQFVAVNSILDDPVRRRVIRVYSREGVLDSVSEPVDGLEGALSWKPSGQLIAGVQRRGQEVDVVFFERNGLRHGEFSLRLEKLSKEERGTIDHSIDLAWNNDSSVLAVSMRDHVQLWTMGNYHYYLKQEILLCAMSSAAPPPINSSHAVSTVWHSEKPLQLACFVDQQLRLLAYTFDVSRGSVVSPDDHGVVAVIDGDELKMTPLRHANVPPPMALHEVDLADQIAIDVAVNKSGSKLAVLHAGSVSLWSCDYKSRKGDYPRLEDTFNIEMNPYMEDRIARQVILDDEEYPVVLASKVNEQTSSIVKFTSTYEHIVLAEDVITNIFQSTNHDRILYQTETGHVHEIIPEVNTRRVGRLPTSCPNVAHWSDSNNDVEVIFGLSAGGILHIHAPKQDLKLPGCTSFIVTNTHLIYTTSQHLLKFLHLHSGELEIPPDEPEKDERCRSIERGAKIVTVMPSAYSLVLQMPRGNLETIYPRALVLAGIRATIQDREYKKAFLICRTHRVDMNILHDYAPNQFMADIDLFVKQVKKVEFIDLFLSSLSEDDVSQTIYKETLNLNADAVPMGILHNQKQNSQQPEPEKQNPNAETIGKTNTICDAFLQVLSGHESTHLQNIVTAHVCKNPPDLEAGLSLVADLRRQGKQEQLEQAVEHICFLADVNRLYDTALGIYDLDVALLVAQQSQKDPREYLPYLQSLHDMPPLRQRHAIDDALKRYPKALGHLHALGEFEEVKAYASKHELFSAAIELYRYDNVRLAELMRLYAEHLSSRNRYKEAGIAFEFIADYAAAYEAYRACSMWRECLSCAGLMGMSEEKMSELARDLADGLEEAKDFVSAATIHAEYLHDVASSVKLLCRAYQFADAIRQVALHRKPELLRDVVDAGLIEGSATMTEMLAEMKSQMAAQVPRLRELRKKKAEDPMGFLDGGGIDGDADIPDNISLAPTDTTTAGTFMTRYTNRSTGTLATNATRKTSKNRRREERKRARGKKGTVYEEEYLVNSIARLIERLSSVGEDVVRLVEGLMRRGMRERAVAVDRALHEVVEFCRSSMPEVFVESVDAAGMGRGQEREDRPWGGEGVVWESLTAVRAAPSLPAFSRLTM